MISAPPLLRPQRSRHRRRARRTGGGGGTIAHDAERFRAPKVHRGRRNRNAWPKPCHDSGQGLGGVRSLDQPSRRGKSRSRKARAPKAVLGALKIAATPPRPLKEDDDRALRIRSADKGRFRNPDRHPIWNRRTREFNIVLLVRTRPHYDSFDWQVDIERLEESDICLGFPQFARLFVRRPA